MLRQLKISVIENSISEEFFTYKFISICSDEEKLIQIAAGLRYNVVRRNPELLKYVEKRIEIVRNNRDKPYLPAKTLDDLSAEDREEMISEMEDWNLYMKCKEREKAQYIDSWNPPPRGSKEYMDWMKTMENNKQKGKIDNTPLWISKKEVPFETSNCRSGEGSFEMVYYDPNEDIIDQSGIEKELIALISEEPTKVDEPTLPKSVYRLF